MSTRSLNKLHPDFRRKAEKILMTTDAKGINLLIYCTVRTCEEQARLYRSTRTWAEIEKKIEQFFAGGFSFLADILIGVGPQAGVLDRHVTWAGPGESWHNYGFAFDAVVMVNGKPDWAMDYPSKWQLYGQIARDCGCEWAGDWSGKKREYVHVQEQSEGSPLKTKSPWWVEKALEKAGVYF